MIFERATPLDFVKVRTHVQPDQVEEVLWRTAVESVSGLAFAGKHNGETVAIGGFEPKWHGTLVAWGLFVDGWQQHALPITRFVRYIVVNDPTPRIEAYVRSDNAKAHRWAYAVGMKCEARRLRSFGPAGEEMDLFARVR